VEIDLGNASSEPTSLSTRKRPNRAPWIAVALAVLALGGSVPAAPQVRGVLVTEELPGSFDLSGTALFTSGYVGGRALVRQYSLTSSRARWTTELPQPVGSVALAEAARVLVVTSPESLQASFLDSETGAVLWRRTSGATTVLRTIGDSALVTTPTGIGAGLVIERVGLRTGAVVWSRGLDPDGFLEAGAAGQVVTVDRRGRGTVLSFADGAVLGTADFGVEPDLNQYDEPGDTARFVTIADRLYLARRNSGRHSLTAYRLPDLGQLWSSTTTPFGWPVGCGSYLCISTGTGMTVADASTGAERWSSTEWRLGIDSRSEGMPGPARLFVSDARHTPRGALLDAATGEVVTELGFSLLRGPTMLRVDRLQTGRTWVQAVGPEGELRTLGSLDGELLERCEAVDAHVACATRRGRVSVWRVT
jgi:hypothetical protein